MIGVFGATGRIGGMVAAELATGDVAACALVRRDDSGLPLPARHADLRDPASLEAAMTGIDRVLLVTPHGPDQDLLEQAAIGAAYRAGVQRIVKVSGSAPSLGPNGPTVTAVAHWRSERLIEEAGFGFTFLRPSFFMQNLVERFAEPASALGLLPSPLGTRPIAMVDARDVAACAVRALLADESDGRAWQLTGPAGVTLPDVARILGTRLVRVPGWVASRALAARGADAFEITHAARMAGYFASGADGSVTDHVEQLLGRPPRSVQALLDEHASDFSPATPLAHALSRLPGA